jgi:hypothetical protein
MGKTGYASHQTARDGREIATVVGGGDHRGTAAHLLIYHIEFLICKWMRFVLTPIIITCFNIDITRH